MAIRRSLQDRLTIVILLTIVLGSSALSLRWVFLVPIFQAPDEHVHLDYALCLNELRGLVHASSTKLGEVPNWVVHPYSLYLAEQTNLHEVAFHADKRMPLGYGTRAFYQALDSKAPQAGNPAVFLRAPSLASVYPYGYYALLAGWLELVRGAVHDRPVAVVFGARIFSVLLLVCSLLLSYATVRELRLRRDLALLLTACIGFFPLTSFVSSYIQPDNLAWTLVSLCYYLGLVARRKPNSAGVLALLGLALGGLLVTKFQFFVCVFVPTLGMLTVEIYRPGSGCLIRCVRAGLLLVLPSLLLGAVHLWVVWGSANFYSGPASYTHFNQFVLGGFRVAILDYFVDATHQSFWGIYGWMDTPIQIHSPKWTERVMFIIQVGTWLFLGLTLVRLERVGSRLLRVARQGRRRLALRMALSNVPLNSYFLFTLLMIVLYVWYQNRFNAQGRNWLPLLLPIFLTSAVYAPKALTLRTSRVVCCWAVILGLLLYCAVGGYYSLRTVKKRYYANESLAWPRAVIATKVQSHPEPDHDNERGRTSLG